MAQTTNYNFELPTVGSDNDNWGQKLNDNWTATDALFAGTTPVAGIDINGGTIDNAVIGAGIAAAASFTTISASGDITGNVIGDIKATDGTVVLNNGSDGTDATFTGNATTATTTATVRAFSVSGDVTTSAGVDFDGSAAVDLDVTISNALWDKIYPVGSIYTTTDGAFDPNNVFNGTWSTYGAGRVLVGQDTNDTDFATINDTDGHKTHTLAVTEMPAHTHIENTVPERSDMLVDSSLAVTVASTRSSDVDSSRTGGTTTFSTGGSQAHNNLQPYVVVKRWRRTG